jgi:hypothetical protein
VSADDAARLVLTIAGAGIALNSAELLVTCRNHQSVAAIIWARRANTVMGLFGPLWSTLLGVRLCSAALLVASAVWGAHYLLPLLLTCLTSLTLARWKVVGADGADQMSLLVMVTMSICTLPVLVGAKASTAGLHFLTAQVLLAYCTAGLAKLSCSKWRGQDVLVRICGTRTYGHRRCFEALSRHPHVSAVLQRAVIVLEIGSPLLLLVPYEHVWLVLLSGVVFHVMCAVIMGLNDFVWAFVAVYPACVYTIRVLQS